MAAPTFVDIGAIGYQGSSAASAGIDFNSIGDNQVVGEAADDIAIFVLTKESTAALTPPASGIWNLLLSADQDTGGFKYRVAVYWARLAGALTTTETWSWTGSVWRYAECLVYRGCVTGETPIVTSLADEETAQNTSPVHPGITIARTDSGLVWFVCNYGDIDTTTPPSGFTLRETAAIAQPRNILTYDDLSTVPGASGTVSATLSGDIEYPLTVLIELATQAGGAAAQQPRVWVPNLGALLAHG